MNAIDSSQFESLFSSDVHWIDVRAPVEFAAGSIPGAVNLPLITDSERHQIGRIYREEGQAAAIQLGHTLVSGPVREERIHAWRKEILRKPNSVLFCFRGGLRSQTVQEWLQELGVDLPIITGGYKALRRFLMESLDRIAQSTSFQVVSGPTGCGKTKYLKQCGKPALDLEALARHRGSAFGAESEAQPSQADFENRIAVELLRLSRTNPPSREIWIEDESRMIGSRYLPETLFHKMKESPKVVLEVPLEERVKNIFRDYVVESRLGRTGDRARFEDFRRSVKAISKKLGGLRTQEILQDLAHCEREFDAGQGLGSNQIWIRKLLIWYYDPLYQRAGNITVKADPLPSSL